METLIIYCDGGSRGNPGPGASAFVAMTNEKRIIAQQGKYLGYTTNNQAEYTAVVLALQFLVSSGVKPGGIKFILDSELVVKQLTGEYRIRDTKLQTLAITVKKLESKIGVLITYYSVPRSQNKLADALVNKVLDKQEDIFVEAAV